MWEGTSELNRESKFLHPSHLQEEGLNGQWTWRREIWKMGSLFAGSGPDGTWSTGAAREGGRKRRRASSCSVGGGEWGGMETRNRGEEVSLHWQAPANEMSGIFFV